MGDTTISYGQSGRSILKWIHANWAQRRGRAMILKTIIGIFPKFNQVSIRMHNIELSLDLRNDSDISYFYSSGIGHEKFYQEVLLEMVSEKTIFYDIGANLGYYSMLLSPMIKGVFSFEPNPFLAQRVETAIANNKIQNIRVFRMGLSNQKSQMMFYFNHSSHVLGSFIKGKHHTQSQKVEVDTLDNTIESFSLPIPDIVKIDTEGYEMQVLEGFMKIVEYQPVILMEWIIPLKDEKVMFDRLSRIIGAHYEVYKIGYEARLVAYADATYTKYSDLLLIPKTHPFRSKIQKWVKE